MKISEWPTVTLNSVSIVFTDGDWIESKDQSPTGIRLIQTGNIGVGEFKDRAEKARYISADTLRRLRCEEIYEGDCLISRLPDPVGRACIIPAVEERLITAVDCTIIRFNTSKVCPNYFRYFSQSAAYLADIESACTGATRKRISRSKLGEIRLPLPALSEQKRIVTILDDVFAAIGTAVANAEKNLANARELFDSYLTTVFSRHDAGWMRRPLSTLCEKITVGHVGSMSCRYKSSGIPFLRSQNIRPFELAMESVVFIDEQFHLELKKSRLRPGDIAVVRTGYPGTAAVIPPELKDANCSDLVIIRPGAEVNPHYLAAFFNSAFGKKLVLGKLVGAAQKHFNIGAAREVLLHYPSVQRQEQIVSELSGFRIETERLQLLCQRKIAALGQLKQVILQKAFAGELTAHPAEAVQEAAE